jgi:NADH-quinone oxidoreductase subunit L
LGGEQDMRQMGGLRKHIPYTFWVMTVATFAIAGFFPLAGFFSKDEILWRALTGEHGGVWFWVVGIVTAFLTSFYMFRLWFMTFFGDYRGKPAAAPDAHGAPGHGALHESPWVMLGPLVVLAALSVVGGWIGWPEALGGGNHFEHFLAPVIGAHAEAAATHAQHSQEAIFAVISVLVACAGLCFSWLFYYKRRDWPERTAAWFGGLYTAVLNKYYVDELYQALFVKPLVKGSTTLLWRGVDTAAIDGTINAGAEGAQELSAGVRQMQSGNLRSYAGWVALGAVAVVIYMIVVGAK